MREISDKEIEAAGDACHKQFISHPPKRSDYLGGFVCGACWMRGRLIDLVGETQTVCSRALDDRERFREALEFVKGHLDHLMDVWGQEGVTRTVRDKIAAAQEPRP